MKNTLMLIISLNAAVFAEEIRGAGRFVDGIAAIKLDKYYYIDKKGKVQLPQAYDFAYEFHEGLAEVTKGGVKGYIHRSGQFFGNEAYVMTSAFKNGYGKVMVKAVDKGAVFTPGYLIIDKTGKVILDSKADRVNDFSEGVFNVKNHDVCSSLTISGKSAFSLPCTGISMFYNGRAILETADGFALIDKKGQKIKTLPFNKVRLYAKEGKAIVITGEKCGYFDINTLETIQPQFEKCSDFSSGRAPVIQNNKWGVIDEMGKFVVKPKYIDTYYNFTEGLLAVQSAENRLYGYIDTSGKLVIPHKYKIATGFGDGLAGVAVAGEKDENSHSCAFSSECKFIYIDKFGKTVIDGVSH